MQLQTPQVHCLTDKHTSGGFYSESVMFERKRFSIDELKKIGWRLKSIRSLTGLNQEEFASKSGIPHMTIKGWELGRALPRDEGILNVISALESFNVYVSREWIIFGEGSGPVFKPNQNDNQIDENQVIIDAYKENERKKGINSIVATVADKLMTPRYNIGDIVAGPIVTLSEAREIKSPDDHWLVPLGDSVWGVRILLFTGDGAYFKHLSSRDIFRLHESMVAKINWIHFAT